MNPLDSMTWQQRFFAAWEALLRAECRAESAEAKVAHYHEIMDAESYNRMVRTHMRHVQSRQVAA